VTPTESFGAQLRVALGRTTPSFSPHTPVKGRRTAWDQLVIAIRRTSPAFAPIQTATGLRGEMELAPEAILSTLGKIQRLTSSASVRAALSKHSTTPSGLTEFDSLLQQYLSVISAAVLLGKPLGRRPSTSDDVDLILRPPLKPKSGRLGRRAVRAAVEVERARSVFLNTVNSVASATREVSRETHWEIQRKIRREEFPPDAADDLLANLDRLETLSAALVEQTRPLYRSTFDDAMLVDLDLHSIDFGSLALRHTDFSRSDLHASSLMGATLYSCDLSGVRLDGANMHFMSIDFSRIAGVDLRKTVLHQCYLDTVDFSGSMISIDNLEFVWWKPSTIWPADIRDAVRRRSSGPDADGWYSIGPDQRRARVHQTTARQ
jgi:uncharacterized protein YjbI with pentapeptide repeats